MQIWAWFKNLLGIKSTEASSIHDDDLLFLQQAKAPSQTSFTASHLLEQVVTLQAANAQWPEIWLALNPDNNSKIQDLLVKLRGPHMFAPHVGLNVIEDGCRRTLASDPNADRATALQAALQDGDTIVRPS